MQLLKQWCYRFGDENQVVFLRLNLLFEDMQA